MEKLKFIGREEFIDDNFILANPYKEFEITIPAGGIENIYYVFSYFQVLGASTTSGIEIRFGGASSATDVISAGVGYGLPAGRVTDRVEIHNTSGASVTLKIGLAIGTINDSRFTASGVVTTKDVGSTLTSARTTISGTPVQLVPANSNRKDLIIYNADNTAFVYVGDSTVTSSSGVALLGREKIVLSTTAEVWVVALGGAVGVVAMEIEY